MKYDEILEKVAPEVFQLSKLNHEHIIRYYECFFDELFIYLVTEYCEVMKQNQVFYQSFDIITVFSDRYFPVSLQCKKKSSCRLFALN